MAKKKNTSARPKKAVVRKKKTTKTATKAKATRAGLRPAPTAKKKAVGKSKPKAAAKKKSAAKSKAVASKRVVTRLPEREVISAGKTPRVITRGAAVVQTKSGFPFSAEQIPALVNGAKATVFLRSYRKGAWNQFEKLPLPSTNDEAWRRTDIRQLKRNGLQMVEALPKATRDKLPSIPARLLKPLVGKGHGGQIVFGPGKTTVQLSREIAKQGVVFTDFASAATKHPELLKKVLGSVVKPGEGKFAAMAAALAGRGVLLYVPKGVQVDEPLHSLLWGPGAGLAYFSHILVWVEDGASVTYVHESASPTLKEQSMHAGIVELHVGARANLRFVELQSWGEHMWNFTHERARVKKDGNLDWIFGALGSHLTKNFSEINLEGEGSLGRMSGFYFTDGNQHLDHDTQQNHLAAHTTSDLLFKGALEEQSRSVWQGMIYVAPGAQRTDGYQANRNLVLSKQARADSIPGLEIQADDVRCTHGATVGKIDPDEYFYLLSRGIPPVEARRLIVKGFFDPIMERIPFEGVRQRFQQAIVQKMK